MSHAYTHIWHLLWRSLVDFPSVISGNWISVMLPVVVFSIKEINTLRQGGWSAVSKQIERDTLVMGGIYFLLFSWVVVQTIYRDHEVLVTSNAHLRQQLSDAKQSGLSMSIDEFRNCNKDGGEDRSRLPLTEVVLGYLYGQRLEILEPRPLLRIGGSPLTYQEEMKALSPYLPISMILERMHVSTLREAVQWPQIICFT